MPPEHLDDTIPIYNSRIVKLFVEYLSAKYPRLDPEVILLRSGMTKYEVEDPGHWFNQLQMDKFYDECLQATGDESIAREAGRYAVSAEAMGPVKQLSLGLLNPAAIYSLLEKLYPVMSRAAVINTRRIGSNKVRITIVPKTGVKEKAYQCENRIGIFEAVVRLFADKFANVEHPECVHRGHDRCVYLVDWEIPLHRQWKKAAAVTALVAVLVAAGSWWLWPPAEATSITLASILSVLAVYLRGLALERNMLIKTVQRQGDAAEDHINEIAYRYRAGMLIQKIGQDTSSIMDIGRLTRIVMEHIANYLDFDRGMIMLSDREARRLVFMAGFGLDRSMQRLLQKTRFRLDNPSARGVFVKAFKEQRPILVGDMGAIQETLSPKSRQVASQVGSKSLICIPIVYERHSLGILAVDNLKSKRPLRKSDVNLLIGVAAQTAVSIFSAMAFKRLRDSEAKFRSLYENAPHAYFSIDASTGEILNCNPAAERLLGYKRKEMLGWRWTRFAADKVSSLAQVRRVSHVLQQGGAVSNEELELVGANGSPVWVSLSLVPFRDARGDIVEGRCIMVDITERKKLEEKLRHAQKMEAIGTLAGGVAHDLNNILSGIVSYPELLMMELAEDSHLIRPLEKIRDSGKRAAAIVQDLLTLARRGVSAVEVINLNNVIGEYLQSPEFSDLAERYPAVKLETRLEESLLDIKGSSVHLIKTIMNLVTNAIEAMPDGGTIRISTANCHLAEPLKASDLKPGDYVVMKVADNGVGIAPEDVNRIFEPFYTKKQMGRSGSGLGMAVVWATVKDHRGVIDVSSQLGIGTTFTLYFPATTERCSVEDKFGKLEELMGNGQTVLVVDDSSEQIDIATTILSKLGYKVSAVTSGEAAVQYVEKHKPDLVILDMIMDPGMDGLETFRKIREIRPDQRAIIASGYSESIRVRQAQSLGAGSYVKKPYVIREIATAVKQELEKGLGDD